MPDISKWDTSKVLYMSFLFEDCRSLQSLPDISKWKTDNVVLMTGMFYDCESLKSIPDILKWHISKNNYIGNIFAQCKSLTIPFKYPFDINIEFINVFFRDIRGVTRAIVLSPDTRVDQMLKLYFLTFEENELMNKQKFIFTYNAGNLKLGDYNTIGKVFINNPNPSVVVNTF